MSVFPKEILPKHTAILGMTGSGKSTTGKDLIEQVVAEGSRVCVLDTIKSDWWGITSSADGKKPGLPFTILGGPHAHLPLSRGMGKAIAEVVATGALPLSIIDMADFGMGDPAHFFVDFAQALMRKMKGVLYLVIEEAHELAPKERTGFQKENLGVYWAKKMATAGRTKGIRLVVLSQRVQALHNAVLGSCQNLIVHRMTTPADQEPVVGWLKGNIKDKALRATVEESISGLADGQGWLCSGEAKIFELKQFPRCKTYDNTATPEDDTELKQVKTATVNTEELRTILAGAVKEAEANDPAILRKRITELERDLRKATPIGPAIPLQITDTKEIERRAYEAGYREGWPEGRKQVLAQMVQLPEDLKDKLHRAIDVALTQVKGQIEADTRAGTVPNPEAGKTLIEIMRRRAPASSGDGVALTSVAHPKGNGVRHGRLRLHKDSLETISIDLPITPVQQRILDAMAELEQMGARTPPSELIALLAGYGNMRSKGFRNALSALRSGGMIEGLVLSAAGRAAAQPPAAPRNTEELQGQMIARLGPAAGRILQPLIDIYPGIIERDELGQSAGYTNTRSKGFRNTMSRLRTLGFLDYPSSGTVTATPALFLK